MILFLNSILTVSMIAFSEFAAKPFVQRACANPSKPASVLTFFFGTNFLDGEEEEEMKAGVPLTTMQSIWYQQSDEYDALCKNSFSAVVREAGSGKLAKKPEWNSSINGIVSQMILCDQLARNCFRGTDEAFAYDLTAQNLAMELLREMKADDRSLPGEFYSPFISFILLPLMHSEKVEIHELGIQTIDDYQKQLREGGNDEVIRMFDNQKGFFLNHKAVLDRFGRYPHRNQKLGRESTSEEMAWLADTDNLPGWAKSQG